MKKNSNKSNTSANRKKRNKDLYLQWRAIIFCMLAIGESKQAAKADGSLKNKILSYQTLRRYLRVGKQFTRWLKENHPDCIMLMMAREYAAPYLESRVKAGYSAWTVQLAEAAINKVLKIRPGDPDRFIPPPRRRAQIKRSRFSTKGDRSFSLEKNAELIKFCRGTGCRRNVLERLRGDDLWSRSRMEAELSTAKKMRKEGTLTPNWMKHEACIKEALHFFPNARYFVHHRKDKGGRYRFAPIIGDHSSEIVARMKQTASGEKVWPCVHSSADIHSYRAEYAVEIYRANARPIEEIPFDCQRRNTGARYQGDVYICRNDMAGIKLDKRAMLVASKALGHNRIGVIAQSYLWPMVKE